MKLLLLAIAVGISSYAKTPLEAMQEAAEKQRAAVRKQVPGNPSNAFFTVGWSTGAELLPPTHASVPRGDCQPISTENLSTLIQKAAVEHSVDPLLIKAMIGRESAGKPCSVSNKGAQGLMQLMPAAQIDLGVSDPFDPSQNIPAGTRYLKQMLTRYGGNIKLALAAYNAGPNRVEPGGNVPDIAETQAYVAEISAAYEAAKGTEADAKP